MNEEVSPVAWRQWLDLHAGRLLLFARQQARRPADAEDLLQEALVEAWRRTPAGALPDVPLVAATIRRRAIDWARQADRRQKREEGSQPDEEYWFDGDGTGAETRAQVQGALQRLSGEQREVLTLKIWGELTFAEIGAVLEIPANTAASRYRYGLERLRQELNRANAGTGT
jgi:RNA polymerase sigma-70 factor (ECF subfamily)